jgi:hypothetical protein
MQVIINQLAQELGCKAENISHIEIDNELHYVDFRVNLSRWFSAKLTKNNKNVKKNSVRKDAF